MLQISYIRENKDLVINGLKKRNFKELELVEEAISLDENLYKPNWTMPLQKATNSPKRLVP